MKMREIMDRLGEAVGQQPRQAPQAPKAPQQPAKPGQAQEDEVDMMLKTKGYQASEEDPNRYLPGQQGQRFNDNELSRDYIPTLNQDGTRTWKSKKNPNGRKFTTDKDGNLTIAVDG